MHIFSPVSPKTNDAVTSLIVSNSSAALAHNRLISFDFVSSHNAIAIESLTISAFFTISAILLNDSKSLWNHFLTLMIQHMLFYVYLQQLVMCLHLCFLLLLLY